MSLFWSRKYGKWQNKLIQYYSECIWYSGLQLEMGSFFPFFIQLCLDYRFRCYPMPLSV
jgi:hypothetical protein